ncbi:MAG: GNAT family N-acetyltransferase [Clostridiales bacterium]|nr:GNAT family N-acetyltransferase [Clostridiales bacterium]
MHIAQEKISRDQYIEFLSRTDLGSQYPRERFLERIGRLLENADISLAARKDDGELIGVLLGITDFAYWLFVTDLGVDRRYTGQGIGKKLLQTAHTLAGGEKDIILYTCANENAVGFYEKNGMEKAEDVMVKNHVDWTPFNVTKD